MWKFGKEIRKKIFGNFFCHRIFCLLVFQCAVVCCRCCFTARSYISRSRCCLFTLCTLLLHSHSWYSKHGIKSFNLPMQTYSDVDSITIITIIKMNWTDVLDFFRRFLLERNWNEWMESNEHGKIFFYTHTCTRPLAAQTHMREIDS